MLKSTPAALSRCVGRELIVLLHQVLQLHTNVKVQQLGWGEFYPMFQEYLLAGRAAVPPIRSLVSHLKTECPTSLPGGWFGQRPWALRMTQEGARPAGMTLCCVAGVAAREGKGISLLFLWAVAQKQDPTVLKVRLPSYSISLSSYV